MVRERSGFRRKRSTDADSADPVATPADRRREGLERDSAGGDDHPKKIASISDCMAFTAMLWELLDRKGKAPGRKWWLGRYVEIAADLEGDFEYEPRGGRFLGFKGPLWKYVQETLTWADSNDLSVVEACDAWRSGAFLLETVPSVLYILMRHAEEPIEAMVRAVNDTKDNDIVGAIVGAAIVAVYEREAFSLQWVTDLSGRTSLDDDGRVFEIIEAAWKTFWDGK